MLSVNKLTIDTSVDTFHKPTPAIYHVDRMWNAYFQPVSVCLCGRAVRVKNYLCITLKPCEGVLSVSGFVGAEGMKKSVYVDEDGFA